MKKKSTELSAFDLLIKRKEASISHKVKDSEIDYSDIPKFSETELKGLRRVGRLLAGESPRQAISLRLEIDIIRKLKQKAKKKGIGYQSLISEILKKAV